MGYSIKERRITRDEVYIADEAFFLARSIAAIIKEGGIKIGNDAVIMPDPILTGRRGKQFPMNGFATDEIDLWQSFRQVGNCEYAIIRNDSVANPYIPEYNRVSVLWREDLNVIKRS